jgi:hypothetical protein
MEGSRDKKPLTDYFEKVWSQALLAVSAAEDEVGKVVHRVTEVAGASQDEVKRQVREFKDRLVQQRKDLEKGVEDGVKGALLKVRLPKREDLAPLEDRLNKVAQRIEELTRKR